MKRRTYPSDLTHWQWKRLRGLLPPAKPGGRPREVDLREVVNGILYIVRGGCAWRMMPNDLPPWSTCYDLWPAEEVLASNRGHEVHEYLPGLFGFGSNGGGELLAFGTRRGPPWRVVTVPYIGMEEDTVFEIAKDFVGSLRATGRDSSAG